MGYRPHGLARCIAFSPQGFLRQLGNPKGFRKEETAASPVAREVWTRGRTRIRRGLNLRLGGLSSQDRPHLFARPGGMEITSSFTLDSS